MSVVIYWTDVNNTIQSANHSPTDFNGVISHINQLRNAGNTHVVMSCEHPNSVGSPGVDTVVDGKLPSGEPYTWSKQHRGAGPQ